MIFNKRLVKSSLLLTPTIFLIAIFQLFAGRVSATPSINGVNFIFKESQLAVANKVSKTMSTSESKIIKDIETALLSLAFESDNPVAISKKFGTPDAEILGENGVKPFNPDIEFVNVWVDHDQKEATGIIQAENIDFVVKSNTIISINAIKQRFGENIIIPPPSRNTRALVFYTKPILASKKKGRISIDFNKNSVVDLGLIAHTDEEYKKSFENATIQRISVSIEDIH